MSSKIIILGDSTLQFNDFTKYPQTGWPQALLRFLKRDVVVKNFAKNGRSTKSFLDEGRLEEAMSYASSGDLVLIEFGHNDLKDDPLRHTDAYGSYQENLRKMVKAAQDRNCDVILLTSIAERKFVNGHVVNTHKDYPQAMKALAEEIKIPCIDLHQKTMDVLEKTGEENSKMYFMNYKDGTYNNISGKEDDTHLRYDGAFMVASCFYDEMMRLGIRRELFLPYEV